MAVFEHNLLQFVPYTLLRRLVWACVCLFAVVAIGGTRVTADDLSAGNYTHFSDDSQDLLFLSDPYPTIIRLHIEVNGVGFRRQWYQQLKELFDQYDIDKNGSLSENEAGRFPVGGQSTTKRTLASLLMAEQLMAKQGNPAGAISRRHRSVVRSVAFSADGKWLASGSDDREIRLWELSTGHLKTTLKGHTGGILSVAFSPDSGTLASAGKDGKILLWDVEKGTLSKTLKGHDDIVTSVVFLDESKALASASFDRTIRVWNVPSGQSTAILKGHTGGVWSVVALNNGKSLASVGNDGTLRIWNIATRKSTTIARNISSTCLAVSPDGNLLAIRSNGNTIQLRDSKTGRVKKTLESHEDRVQSLTFSPDGGSLASASWDKTIRIWNVSRAKTRTVLRGHSDRVQAVAFSPDGLLLASGGNDRTVRFWDVLAGVENTIRPRVRITPAEIVAIFERHNRGPFQTSLIQTGGPSIENPLQPVPITSLAEQLFESLDSDGDGDISRRELASAESSLGRLDLDDDETISISELQTIVRSNVTQMQTPNTQPTGQSTVLMLSRTGDNHELVRQLIQRYQKNNGSGESPNRRQVLTRSALGLSENLFDRYDINKDSRLDVTELAEFLKRSPPDIEITAQLGEKRAWGPRMELTKQQRNVALRFVPIDRESAVISDRSGQMEFGLGGAALGRIDIQRFYVEQFRASDKDNNAYLEPKEIAQSTIFREMFSLIDKNGDGKAFVDELTEYVDRQRSLARNRIVLNIADFGRNLFDVLDSNRDRKLGTRELRNALKRMPLWDTNGDGKITANEIPRQMRLVLDRAQPDIPGLEMALRDSPLNLPTPKRTAGGPEWFNRMDRNGDGDVSRREFLGTSEQFQTLDRDGDGLIDAREASTASILDWRVPRQIQARSASE